MRKQSKQSISLIQRKIWVECKRIVRATYPHFCYTCGKPVEGANMQTGHLWAKASLGAFLKYDLRVLRLQCWFCNIHCGGQGAVFYARMLKEEGQEYMDKLEQDKRVTVKAMDFYLELLERYKEYDLFLIKTPYRAT